MKRISFLLIAVIILLITFSCKKTTTNFDDLVGNYKGNIFYTNYFSIDGNTDESGTENEVNLRVEKSDKNNMDLKLSYTFGSDVVVLYINNVTKDGGQYYFNMPEQLNEENNPVRGNQCQYMGTTKFDGIYIMSSKILTFCTHYKVTTSSNNVYGETNETYTKL